MRKILIMVAVLVTAGAGVYLWNREPKTRHQVILRHEDDFARIRTQLNKIATLIPPPGKNESAACNGITGDERPFHYDHNDIDSSNTALIGHGQLRDPAAASKEDWEYRNFDLAEHITAISPGHRPTEADLSEADDEDVRNIEAMAKVRYVMVIRVNEVTFPYIFAASDPVLIDFDATIAELSTQKVLCTITAQAEASSTYLYSPGEETTAYNDHITRAGSGKLEPLLNSLDRGTFAL